MAGKLTRLHRCTVCGGSLYEARVRQTSFSQRPTNKIYERVSISNFAIVVIELLFRRSIDGILELGMESKVFSKLTAFCYSIQ